MLPCCHVRRHIVPSAQTPHVMGKTVHQVEETAEPQQNSKGGWRSAIFVLGNECCDRLVIDGLSVNLVTYLKGHYNMSQVASASTVILVSGTSNLAALIGAFISDTYLGRYSTIMWACVFKLLGTLLLTATAVFSDALTPTEPRSHPSTGQLAFLGFALGCIVTSVGGIRPCSYAFGADQFKKDDKIKLQSYFNWYFFALYVGSLIGSTFLVYVQDDVGWAWGFGIPSIISGFAIAILLLGIPLYRHVPPMGSPYPRFFYVIVAAIVKRKATLPPDSSDLYQRSDGAALERPLGSKLSHTNSLKCLDHAAIKKTGDFNQNGNLKSRFTLCTVQQVEELKSLVRLLPILLIDMLVTAVLADQSGGFYVFQAKTMDRHLFSHSFQIPAASMIMFTSLTHVIWMPIYDKVIVPALRRITGDHRGITLLQRLGIGIFLSVISLFVSGIVETKRRGIANRGPNAVSGDGTDGRVAVPLSVFWLAPELCLKGLSDAFRAVAQLEFLHNQLPESMHCVGGAIYWCSKGLGSYLGTFLLQLVHKFTGKHGQGDWLTDNLNHGHLDYFFYLLASFELLFFVAFLIVSRYYTYKQ